MNTKNIISIEEIQMPNRISNEEEYKKYIQLLDDNSTYIAKKALGDKELNDIINLVDLLESYDGKTLFIISYTNNTEEIKGFINSDEALRYAYSDHLLNCSPLKSSHYLIK